MFCVCVLGGGGGGVSQKNIDFTMKTCVVGNVNLQIMFSWRNKKNIYLATLPICCYVNTGIIVFVSYITWGFAFNCLIFSF